MRIEATLLAVLVGIAISTAAFFGITIATKPLWLPIGLMTIPVFVLTFLSNALLIAPLQRAGAGLSPYVVSLYQQDPLLNQSFRILHLMPIVFLSASFVLLSLEGPFALVTLALWIIAFGLTIDTFRAFLERSLYFLNPSSVVTILTEKPISSTDTLLSHIDSLTEVALKSLNSSNSNLAQEAIRGMIKTMRQQFEAVQSSDSPEEREATHYAIYSVIEHLEMLYLEAQELLYVPVCDTIITSLGKLSALTAVYDLRAAITPIHAIASLGHEALEENDSKTAIKASCTIQEVARTILSESQETSGFSELFQSIVQQLSDLTKEMFRQDKTTPIPTLMTPFLEIKKSLEESPYRSDSASEKVLQALDGILEQFSALEHVMANKEAPQQPPKEAVPEQSPFHQQGE